MMKRLLFVGSVGYSGSTLLDMILGTQPGFVSLGEVAKLADFYANGLGCTCGERVAACPFWREVERAVAEQVRPDDPAAFRLGEFRMLSPVVHASIHRKMPSLVEALLLLGNRRLWQAAARRAASVAAVARAADNSLLLFDTIAQLRGAEIIVDSSKEPVKLKSQFLADPQRFRLVFLVRDGRAVTFSQMKHKQLGFEAAARRWARYNWNLQWMMKTIPRQQVLFVRYEDLCRDVPREIERILRFVGVEPQTDLNQVQLDKVAYHNIGGNPMRRRVEESRIVLDEKWRTMITPEQEQIFQRVAGRWNRRFGYE